MNISDRNRRSRVEARLTAIGIEARAVLGRRDDPHATDAQRTHADATVRALAVEALAHLQELGTVRSDLAEPAFSLESHEQA